MIEEYGVDWRGWGSTSDPYLRGLRQGFGRLEAPLGDFGRGDRHRRASRRPGVALREKRARLIKATAEQEASIKLSEASKKIMENPAALELRRLQMLTEIGAENNTESNRSRIPAK